MIFGAGHLRKFNTGEYKFVYLTCIVRVVQKTVPAYLIANILKTP